MLRKAAAASSASLLKELNKHVHLFSRSASFLFLHLGVVAQPLPSLSFWISGSNIWRLRYRLGPSVIGLLRVIHFCNLGDGLMWSLHPCPYYDSVSVCREGRLVRGAIDWSFTLPALSAPPLLLYPSFSLTH